MSYLTFRSNSEMSVELDVSQLYINSIKLLPLQFFLMKVLAICAEEIKLCIYNLKTNFKKVDKCVHKL